MTSLKTLNFQEIIMEQGKLSISSMQDNETEHKYTFTNKFGLCSVMQQGSFAKCRELRSHLYQRCGFKRSCELHKF